MSQNITVRYQNEVCRQLFFKIGTVMQDWIKCVRNFNLETFTLNRKSYYAYGTQMFLTELCLNIYLYAQAVMLLPLIQYNFSQ